MMPDIYGLDLLRHIKQDPLLSYIPVILQSGTAYTHEIEQAFNMGAVSFITKPYPQDQVYSQITKALNS